MSVRVGVIGTGWWATRAHLPALEAHPDAVITAIADPSDANRSRAADRFGVVRTYADALEMLDAEELDAAVVATPHVTHAPLARACLERGLHVLVEKPMTIDAGDAFDLVALARQVGRELIVGYPWHYSPQALALRDAIARGVLGPIESVNVLFASMVRELYRGRPEPYRDALGYPLNAPGESTYSDPAIAGGGQAQTQLTHSTALLLWLTGLVPAEVSAFTADFELAVDLVDAVAVRFDGGAIGTLASTGGVLPGQDELLEVRLFGPDGHVRWDVIDGRATIHAGASARELPVAGLVERYPEAAPVGNLVGVALGREPNGSPGEIGALTVALIDAMYTAARDGTRVRILHRPPWPPEEGDGMSEAGHFRAIDHVGYAVADLDRSIGFYEALLGVPLLMRKTWDVPYVGDIVGYPDVVMEGAFFRLPGGVVLELLEYKAPYASAGVDMESYNAGNAHLCLVTDDMEADFVRVRAAGYDGFRSPEPIVIPWGPYKGGRACYLRDPDGISIELLEEPPGGPDWNV